MGMRLAGAVVLVACAVGARGQAALQDELKKLGVAAQSLQRDLPSFECQETALSQVIQRGKVKDRMRFVAKVRVERAGAGRLDEELEVSEVNGKPEKGRFDPPFLVGGGFGESLVYFLPATQPCFLYTLSGARIDFAPAPGVADRAQCIGKAATGFLLLDNVNNPAHLERTAPHEYSQQLLVVHFSAVDFMPAELDGKMYSLTSKVVAEEPKENGVTLHFEATYTGCHLFKATSRILPGETVVPEPGGPHPKP